MNANLIGHGLAISVLVAVQQVPGMGFAAIEPYLDDSTAMQYETEMPTSVRTRMCI